jgi:predicted ArsR family transcriptional regulator
VVQTEILGEVSRMGSEVVGAPKPLSVVRLAKILRCDERQVRRAVRSLESRGLVVVAKEARPGRQGRSLMVWEPRIYESWMNFIDPARHADPSHY